MSEKKKSGRPLKPLPATVEQIEALAALGMTMEEMCGYLGITKKTLYKRKAEVPALDQAIERGRTRADAEVVKSLYHRATREHDTTAMIFWLKNRQPDRFRDRRDIEHSGAVQVDGKLEIVVVDTEGKPVKE